MEIHDRANWIFQCIFSKHFSKQIDFLRTFWIFEGNFSHPLDLHSRRSSPSWRKKKSINCGVWASSKRTNSFSVIDPLIIQVSHGLFMKGCCRKEIGDHNISLPMAPALLPSKSDIQCIESPKMKVSLGISFILLQYHPYVRLKPLAKQRADDKIV